jgi:hypothetical protein
MRLSADVTAPAQVWNETVVVPDAPHFPVRDGIGRRTCAITLAKAPSQPGDHTEQITSAMFTLYPGLCSTLTYPTKKPPL